METHSLIKIVNMCSSKNLKMCVHLRSKHWKFWTIVMGCNIMSDEWFTSVLWATVQKQSWHYIAVRFVLLECFASQMLSGWPSWPPYFQNVIDLLGNPLHTMTTRVGHGQPYPTCFAWLLDWVILCWCHYSQPSLCHPWTVCCLWLFCIAQVCSLKLIKVGQQWKCIDVIFEGNPSCLSRLLRDIVYGTA